MNLANIMLNKKVSHTQNTSCIIVFTNLCKLFRFQKSSLNLTRSQKIGYLWVYYIRQKLGDAQERIMCLWKSPGFSGVLFSVLAALRGILVPQPGPEPAPLSLEARSLNHWTAREVPNPLSCLCLVYTAVFIVITHRVFT